MSRERELLESALKFFEAIGDVKSVGIERAIAAYLAEPEVKREALSDEEIFNLYIKHEDETSVHSTIFHFNKFARAIEARVLQREPLKKNKLRKDFRKRNTEKESLGVDVLF